MRIDAVLSTLGAGDAVRRARAMEARSIALLHSGQLEAGQAAAESAMALQGLPPEQTARLLDMLAYRNFLAGQPAQAVPFAERALALWQALHATRWVARARTMLGTLLGMQGDLDRALAELDAARELAAASGLPEQQREATLNLVNFALHRGQARRVLALLAELDNLPQAYTRRHRQMGLMLVRHAAHAHLGELLASLQATRLQAARIAGVLRAEHLAAAQAALAANQLPAIESWRFQGECACAAHARRAHCAPLRLRTRPRLPPCMRAWPTAWRGTQPSRHVGAMLQAVR